MNREFFEILLLLLAMRATNRIVRRGTPIVTALMMTLWILATPDTFRSVRVKFGLNQSTVHDQYKIIIEVLHELCSSYVKWPNDLEKEEIAAMMEDTYGYPSVIGCINGCINGCLIKITAPLEQPCRYIERHHNHPITVQGVCDHRMLFKCWAAWECRRQSDISEEPVRTINSENQNIMDDKLLLGDGAYTITEKLMIPFRDNGYLTPLQRGHNYNLSRCRSRIERAFALLKGKWRRLKFFSSYCLDYAVDHIMACITLHIFLILEGQAYEEEDDVEPNLVPLDLTNEELFAAVYEKGSARRLEIAHMLVAGRD